MTLPLSLSAAALVLSLTAAPVLAQSSHSDMSGSVPMSDASGSLTKNEQVFVQSNGGQIRMSDIASTLAQALQSGELGTSVTGQRSVVVSERLATLFLTSSRREQQAMSQEFTATLTTLGVPTAEAAALAEAAVGLLGGGTVNLAQFRPALHAFNAVVDVAPASFLAQPPMEFVAVRVILMSLLDGAAP